VAEGDLTHRVYLRKGDQLTELQDQFNNMAGAVNEAVKEYEKFRAEAAAAGMQDRAEALRKRVAEIMPKFKV
jgi:nitrogen fixation/metabolism regulation signal transduction histidine kinase